VTTTAVTDAEAPPAAEPPSPPSTGLGPGTPRSPLGMFAAVLVFLATTAYSPVVNYQSWTPKAALLPLVLAVGAPLLVSARRGVWARTATAGLALVVVAAVSTLFAVNHTVAVFGLYGWGTGLLFVAALPAAWAIGNRLDPRGRADVRWALVAGVVANVVVGVLELRLDLDFARLTLVEGRPTGLLGGSVPFSQVMAAGAALAAAAFAVRRAWTLAFVVAVAVGVQIGGGRFALAVLVVAAVWVLVRQGVRPGVVFAALAVAGLLLGAAASHGTGSASASARVAGEGSSGVRTRLENWKVAAGAVADRPVLGVGPGGYSIAVGPRRTLELARSEGSERLFADGHNLVVEYATTTGIAGLAAFAAFAGLALWPARGWAGGAALALLAMHGVEPQHVMLTPLVFLLAGVGTPPGAAMGSVIAVAGRRVTAGLVARAAIVVVGVAMAAVLLFADFELHQSDLDFTIGQARTGMRLLPRWKEPPALQARNYLYYAIVKDDPALYERSRRWRLEGVRREPTDSQSWTKLADVELRLLQLEPAERHFHAALRANPQSVTARIGLAQVLMAGDRPADAVDVLQEAMLRRPGGRNREIVDQLLTEARRLQANA
jgi:O-antigen ligase